MRAAAAAVVLAALMLAACENSPVASDRDRRGSDVESPPLRSGLARDHARFRDDPWSYNGRGGRVVSTPHYRIYMTQTEPTILGRVPMFLEAALEHYRIVATGTPLPLPTGEPMSTFVFRHRDEWERLTRQMLAENAGPFLRIQRGGYSWGGTAVLFDLGSADTLTIAAHEGWHQFTQRSFRQSLPTWLEESIATMCEGYAWTAGGVEFHARDNPERLGQLRIIVNGNRLKGVERLVLEAPANLSAAAGDDSEALDYYAQVWALGLYLREGDQLRHAEALRSCIGDAAAGAMAGRIVQVLGRARAEGLAVTGRGLAVLETYFAPGPAELAAFESGYRAFVVELISTTK